MDRGGKQVYVGTCRPPQARCMTPPLTRPATPSSRSAPPYATLTGQAEGTNDERAGSPHRPLMATQSLVRHLPCGSGCRVSLGGVARIGGRYQLRRAVAHHWPATDAWIATRRGCRGAS